MRYDPAATRLVLVMLVAAGAGFGALGAAARNVGDVWAFAAAGSTLLSASWQHAFHYAGVQAGPLELVLCSLARRLGGGPRGFAIVLDLGCWAAVVLSAASLFGRRPLPLLLFGAGACALALPGEGYSGHPAELLIGALWLLAAREARRGRLAPAAALVGCSACLETWGILGVTTLALAPRLRPCGRALGLTAAIPAAAFLPFLA